MSRGVLSGVLAYGLWGLLPIYWKLVDHVPPMEILGHRILWSLVFCLLLLAMRGRWSWLRNVARDRALLGNFAAASALLSFNWGLYIWAVNTGHVVETSLGYFMNPLVSVTLAVLVLRESLRKGQWIAVGLAALGVLYLAFVLAQPPWISLSLALSFGTYGLLKNRARLPALEGLSLETILVVPPALGYLVYLASRGQAALVSVDVQTSALLIGAGIATATPLLFFADAARRIPLTLLGLLQFLAPTMQFCLGVFVYDEPFSKGQLIGFALIWAGLLVFALEGLQRRRSFLPG